MKTKITKRFKFYAAHRNEEIGGKCASIHGHRYGVEVTICEPKNGSITILFDDIEKVIDPIIADLDHSLILHSNDPEALNLMGLESCQKVYQVPFPTSAENLAEHLFKKILSNGLNVLELSLQETDSSTVTVSYE